MKKNILKFLSVFCLVMTIIFIQIIVNAAYEKPTFEVTKESADTKYLANNQGYVTKKIVDSNIEKGEATVELKLYNYADPPLTGGSELIILMDDSGSMSGAIGSGGTRKTALVSATTELVNQVLDGSNEVKVGLVSFEDTAKVICNLTEDKTNVNSALGKFKSGDPAGGTNIEKGLILANNTFSSSCKNKILILLTDGVPTGDASGSADSGSVTQNTKNRLITIGNSATIITMGIEFGADIVAPLIFGTPEKPTAGKFYDINDYAISDTVKKEIYSDIMKKVQNPMKDITITDYFPQEIIDNFNFEIVTQPDKGTIGNLEGNSIKWEIDRLKGNDSATVKYKLTVKDMNKEAIHNKEMATNQKVTIAYTDNIANAHSEDLTSSPKVIIRHDEPEEDNNTTGNTQNNTTQDNNTTGNTQNNTTQDNNTTGNTQNNTTQDNNTTGNTQNNQTVNVIQNITNTTTNTTTDGTIAKKEIPHAGTQAMGVTIPIFLFISILSYFNYKKLDI